MMPPYVEYEYECLCGNLLQHGQMCKVYNARRKQELAQSWQETGIARHWREQAELEARYEVYDAARQATLDLMRFGQSVLFVFMGPSFYALHCASLPDSNVSTH